MNKEFFAKNREKLINVMEDNSMVILFAGDPITKSEDEEYGFSVNNNFFYMTGIENQGTTLVITKRNNVAKQMLYIDDFSDKKQLWVGRQITADFAKERSGIEDVKYLSAFDADMHYFMANDMIKSVSLDLSRGRLSNFMTPSYEFANKIKERYVYININNIYKNICDFRFVKETEEIEAINKAIDITNKGLNRVLANMQPDIYEYELEANFQYVLRKNGVTDNAFATIAASGKNACTLHYGFNDTKIGDNELVLFDLGAKWNHYSADISRTYPSNGKFTQRQKLLYNIVLEANKRGIAASKPGMTNRRIDLEIIVPYFTEKLLELGIIKDASETRKYYPHSVSHSMGMDDHDVGFDPETRSTNFVVGSVHSIEPGLYIPEEGIGIRIEDDILITENGCINLSEGIIKEVDDIEEYMAKNNKNIK